jgi:hypothetical protein
VNQADEVLSRSLDTAEMTLETERSASLVTVFLDELSAEMV